MVVQDQVAVREPRGSADAVLIIDVHPVTLRLGVLLWALVRPMLCRYTPETALETDESWGRAIQ